LKADASFRGWLRCVGRRVTAVGRVDLVDGLRGWLVS
jgi:hypothetical protein